MSLALRDATAADREAADALAATHPWPEAGFYRLFGFDLGTPQLAGAVGRFLSGLDEARPEAAAVLASEGAQPVGLAALARQPWESGHFGLDMGSVPFLLAPGEPRARAARVDALLDGIERTARERGLRHLSLRLDVNDAGALDAAQRRRWRQVDTLVTWVHDSQTLRERAPEDAPFELVTLRKEDLARVPRAELAELEEFVRRAYRMDRFHADLRLPEERSDALYVAWFRKVFDGSWADGAQALRRDGRMVGFCSFQHLEELEQLGGPRVIGRGLAAVLPEAKGGYAVLTRMIHRRCPLGSRFQEFDTQLQNFPTINVWARESMRFVRARATLHRWLDE